MKITVIFSDQRSELLSFPSVQLTRSKTGKTGTATFLFYKPNFLEQEFSPNQEIEQICLHCEDKVIFTKTIQLGFQKGKPVLIKGIFLFKNDQDWYCFLNFMALYSRRNQLAFSNF